MAKITNTAEKRIVPSVNRPGVHSKSQTSSLKSSKNYKKAYRSQGRV